MTDTRDELARSVALTINGWKPCQHEVRAGVSLDMNCRACEADLDGAAQRVADAILASGVLDNLRADARREGAIEALEEAADERGELWMLGTNSVHYDCAETVATWLHGRAATFYAQARTAADAG